MGIFNERDTLVYCDIIECKWNKKRKSKWDKKKYITICGAKYVHIWRDERILPSDEEIAKRKVTVSYCSELLPR